jgi:thiol-disulfide isomerase/thioredoxin
MRTTFAIGLIFLAGCGSGCFESMTTVSTAKNPATTSEVKLKPVKIAELEKAVADQKGKVVVLDVWFLGCAPCVKKFPAFVEMSNTYAAAGLVCMSVDVEMDDIEKKDKVLEFLTEKQATFANYIISDDVKTLDAWQKKNDANATPSYVVYNRKGEQVPVSQSIKPDDMKALVKKLLDEK